MSVGRIDGLDRGDMPYAWPPRIIVPDQARLVYLDLNHWVGLAKARAGHPDAGIYTKVLEHAQRARDTREVIFPLSSTHYMELAKVRSPEQRAAIGAVMADLSGFCTILSHTVIHTCEIEASLDTHVARRPDEISLLHLLGRGVGHAFGRHGFIGFRDGAGTDVTAKLRGSWGAGPDAFDDWRAEIESDFEKRMLAGPTNDDLGELKSRGWNPYAAHRVAERRASQEKEQARRLDGESRWRRGRLRDVVAARYLTIELWGPLVEGLGARGLTISKAFPTRAESRAFVDSMPSGDAYVSLMTLAHRDPQHAWSANDIFDIDALSAAVAYCDLVATDRERVHGLVSSGVASRLDTDVVASPHDLLSALQAQDP